jgi:hypothetical protein
LQPIPGLPDFPHEVEPQPLIVVKNAEDCGGPGGALAATFCRFRAGSFVFLNYGLSAWLTHTTQACDGDAPDPAPDYAAGTYEGRVEVLTMILRDLFDLDPE